MLLGQQRRGRQDRHLVALHHRCKRRAQRHFRLAETDVSADEPVHRPPCGQVVQHLFHGPLLVVRKPVRETGRKGAHLGGWRAHGRHGARRPLRLQFQQFRGDVPQLLFGPPLDPVPGVRAEPVQRGVLGVAAGIAGYELHVRNGHVKAVAARVQDLHELRRCVADVHMPQAFVAADAVVLVHDGRSGA